MKRLFFMLLALLLASGTVHAQRFTDKLNRGLVAVPTGPTDDCKSNFVSWRRFAEEYYGVTYNLYRDGVLIASGLTKSSYDDSADSLGTPSVRYQVAAVVNGVEQEKCDTIRPWSQYVYNLVKECPTGYIDIPLKKVYDRNGNDVTDHYEPNDAEVADLDGDGEMEIIVKRINTYDAANIYPISNTTEFVMLDAYDVDWHTGKDTLLWRIDCGPNMVSLNSTEINIIAYDWDEDGKAEVVLRGADNMIVYGRDGKTVLYTIGDMNVNTRDTFDPANGAQYAWTHTGAEYLIYMNGETGALYQKTDFPLLRLEYASTLSAEWGGRGYGHNSSKYFFGAPILDGRNASLFLARGIYGTHKMIAMDLNQRTHQWSQKWRWNCNNTSSQWYGQGYHNFVIADVDEDGRDEIVYGSMVIDDTGKGLSTTGLGHGDAQHVGDLDPWRKGLEFFGCLEESTGFDYRNATTGEIYYRTTTDGDDGRCIAGNFLNTYPGSVGRSAKHGMISCISDKDLSDDSDVIAWSDCNFRIYWDGDLCSEILNSPGTARDAKVEKPGLGRLFTSSGCNMNNDSKNNPCFQGDIIGDWREELILRCGGNLRVYTSGMSTDHDIYTLWHDHQYRQAMAWQMMAYNQPPHLSFFLGEMEDITVAPPPLTITDRTLLENGATITTANNGQHLLITGYSNMTVNVGEGAQPQILTVNAPVWVKGNDNNNNITTTTYQHTISGTALTGKMNLTKQGWGNLILSDNTHTYTGPTEVWQGTLTFNGTLSNSPLWLNRLTSLNSSGGTFSTIKADYGASINIGGPTSNVSSITVNELNLGFGSKVVFDINGDTPEDIDQLIVGVLNIEKKTGDAWVNYGPEYLAPRFWFNSTSTLTASAYPLGQIGELGEGCNLDDIIVEGFSSRNPRLTIENGILYLRMDEAKPTVAPELAVIDMVQADLEAYPAEWGPYFLPKVAMRSTSDNTTLSGYFTDTEGNTTNLDSEQFVTLRYEQDHEGNSTVTDWVTGTGCIVPSIGYDQTHGNYLNLAQDGGTGSRYSYTSFSVELDEVYCMEFDVAFHPAQENAANNSLILYGGNVPDVKNSWWEWSGSTDYVFRISGGANKGTTYTVEGDNNSFTLSDNAWYHFKVVVNQTTREVSYSVYSGSSTLATGNYTISDANIQMLIHGMFVNLGRKNSNAKIDNIKLSNDGEPAFTFTRPGTLYLTASEDGYSDNTVSMTIERPYVIQYDSPDFSTIAAADAAASLGTDLWQTATSSGTWSYWENSTSYTFATAFRQNQMYVDSNKVLWANIKSGHPGNRLLQLVEGFGLGQNVGSATDVDGNEGTVFHAAGLGDEKTIIYHRYDLSRGAANKTYLSEYFYADADGNYNFDCGGNFTLQKFTAYVPYENVLMGDANGDGRVTVADVMLAVRYVVNGGADGIVFRNTDMNFDNNITVADIMSIVRLITE